MISIYIVGVDKYLVEEKLATLHEKISNVFEVKAEEVSFVALDGFVIHKGVEQSSYRANIYVVANHKYEIVEENVSKLLLTEFKDLSIHTTIQFYYPEHSHYHESIDYNYPSYLTEENQISLDEEEEAAEEEIYTGNVFEEFDKVIEEKNKSK